MAIQFIALTFNFTILSQGQGLGEDAPTPMQIISDDSSEEVDDPIKETKAPTSLEDVEVCILTAAFLFKK